MSSEYNLDLHIPQKRKDLKKLFSRMKKEELSFIFENNGSLTNKREKFMKQHNRNITCLIIKYTIECESMLWESMLWEANQKTHAFPMR